MSKFLFEAEVPEGYVGVGFRPPKRGDLFLNYRTDSPARVETAGFDYTHKMSIIVERVKPPHLWPDHIPDGWIAVDRNKEAHWYRDEPYASADEWDCDSQHYYKLSYLQGLPGAYPKLPDLDSDWMKNKWRVKRDDAK